MVKNLALSINRNRTLLCVALAKQGLPCVARSGNGERSRGFTLIEMVTVIGIFSVLGGAMLFIDMNTFRGDSFRAERETLVASLQTARAESLNNVNQAKHGVAVYPAGVSGYVIFEGDSYQTRDSAKDTLVPSLYGVEVSACPISPTCEIIFKQLSGDSTAVGEVTITLRDPQRSVTESIKINHEGAIIW